MATTDPPWKENFLPLAGILGFTTLLCVVILSGVCCILYYCSNPNQLPAWLRTLRDLLQCYKYHPHASEATELNMLPLNETELNMLPLNEN